MSGSAPARGRAAIRTAIEAMVRSGVKIRIGAEQNTRSGDIAYVYGRYAVLDHDAGKTVEVGSYLELWRRRNGRWQIDFDVNATGPVVPASGARSDIHSG
jgi:ketosteroid isomerase-like protein